MKDADNPSLAIRDTWSAVQSVLHSQRHLQTTIHSNSHVTLRPLVPSLFSQAHRLIHTPAPYRLCFPLLDHSWRISLRYTDQEWQTWCSAAWQSTRRWLSALGADRDAQSFDWPTAAQHSWSQSAPAAADAAGPMHCDAPQQDTHRSAKDVSTKTSWTMPRGRVRFKRSTPAGPHLDTIDQTGHPLSAHALSPLTLLACLHRPCRYASLAVRHALPRTAWPPSPSLFDHLLLTCRTASFLRPPRLYLHTSHRRRMPVPSRRENQPPSTMLVAQVANPFQSRRPLCSLCHVLLSPSPVGKAPSWTLSVISCTTSTASLCSSGMEGQRARTPRRSFRQPVDAFMM